MGIYDIEKYKKNTKTFDQRKLSKAKSQTQVYDD